MNPSANKRLVPSVHTWVRLKKAESSLRGLVVSSKTIGTTITCIVQWQDRQQTEETLDNLGCGFVPGQGVVPARNNTLARGLPAGGGTVEASREIGGREQVLVQWENGAPPSWTPYELLQYRPLIKHLYFQQRNDGVNSAERFRLKVLANALELWDQNTGALSKLDIDPLPHQIHLVHHILASGNLNWLIADDVGLGKTIETGMLLSALTARKVANRVLLVTPAGLTKQWKDELYYKFGFEDFQIFGEDFSINEARHWKMHDKVIASIDQLKATHHLDHLTQGPAWDLVIFDEGHRLTRRQYGKQYHESERFRLAKVLRRLSSSLIILSATPHQGKQDKFAALLMLLRPEKKEQIELLSLDPSFLGEMVFRNHKADVTDQSGQFIFKGKEVYSVPVPQQSEAADFDRRLRGYLEKSFKAADSQLKSQQRAIGFVLTTYRKLASSSFAAIAKALHKRLNKLDDGFVDGCRIISAAPDIRYQGEHEEQWVAESNTTPFFGSERKELQELVMAAKQLIDADPKAQVLIQKIIQPLLAQNDQEKILIFTEYRTTQQFLFESLTALFGSASTGVLHGSLSHAEREAVIADFSDDAQFLISTEAGGEGINLQHNCHIMVNYDLPWNPARLMQRVGRLYRYGQENVVQVFNLSSSSSMDDRVLGHLYEKLNSITSDMANVESHEFKPGLEDEVLGQLANLADLESILGAPTGDGIQRTQARVDAALEKAQESTQKQLELFRHAATSSDDELSRQLNISEEHLESFVRGMCEQLDIRIRQEKHNGKMLDITLPESLAEHFGTSKVNFTITWVRKLASENKLAHLLDTSSFLMNGMLEVAKSTEFGGRATGILGWRRGSYMAATLSWQNAQGVIISDRLSFIGVGGAESYPTEELLLEPVKGSDAVLDKANIESAWKEAELVFSRQLAEECSEYLHPNKLSQLAVAWRA